MPIARPLLAWYDRAKRDLPWRRAPSPYKTLVSEFMLQQTVVATVEPYFDRFIARFPTLAALAAASEDEVTALWSGLGYYARARNLRVRRRGRRRARRRAAANEEALRELPGVGPYTAAAVAAIAFGARTFALDGNGARVTARLWGVRDSIDRPATREALRAAASPRCPAGAPATSTRPSWSWARPSARRAGPAARPARCDVLRCPRDRAVDAFPRRTKRGPTARARRLRLRDDGAGRVLLVRRRRGLLAGTWALPEVVESTSTSEATRDLRGGRRPPPACRRPRSSAAPSATSSPTATSRPRSFASR